jgi:hypothetical protein
MTKKSIRNWEIAGIAFIFLLGTLLHFVFGWTGNWRPIAWFVPVNESVWEHFKLAFWPGLTFAAIEYFAFGKSANNFWIGKGLGLLSMPIFIGLVYYGHVAVLGEHYLAVDILSFFLAAVLGQWISYKFMSMKTLGDALQWFGIACIVALIAVFVIFSYQTPYIFIFEDGNTHTYGIPGS